MLVPVLALGGILGALMHTIVVPILPELPGFLGTSPTGAYWVVTATLLSAAVTTPISGRLGDMYGRRRILIACVVCLVSGSVVCSLSTTLTPMIVGRLLQGAATSIVPLGISILRVALPRRKVPVAIAVISSSLGAGSSIALPAAGFIASRLDWHLLFAATALLGIVVLLLILAFVPRDGPASRLRFDFVGAAGLSVGLCMLLLAITNVSSYGWSDPRIVGAFVGAAIVFALWTWFQSRTSTPLVDIRVSASRPVLLTNLATIATGYAMFVLPLVTPQILQAPPETGYGLGQSLFVASLCIAPAGLVMMLGAPLAARISMRRGPRLTLAIGLVVIAVNYALAPWLMVSPWHLVLLSVLNGAGVSFAFSSLPALILGAVPQDQSGSANGLNTLMRSIGTTLSSGVSSLVVTSMVVSVDTVAYPDRHAFITVFGIACGVAVAALAITIAIPKNTGRLD